MPGEGTLGPAEVKNSTSLLAASSQHISRGRWVDKHGYLDTEGEARVGCTNNRFSSSLADLPLPFKMSLPQGQEPRTVASSQRGPRGPQTATHLLTITAVHTPEAPACPKEPANCELHHLLPNMSILRAVGIWPGGEA